MTGIRQKTLEKARKCPVLPDEKLIAQNEPTAGSSTRGASPRKPEHARFRPTESEMRKTNPPGRDHAATRCIVMH
jgi:hypothetical protein